MTQITAPAKPATRPRTAYRTPHTARRVQAARYPGDPERWRVSWLPDQLVTAADARLALGLAELLFDGPPPLGTGRRHRIEVLASGLDLTVDQAADLVARPPHVLDRRFHTMSTACWCRPRLSFDRTVHIDPVGEPVFAATDQDPIDADGHALEDHR
ncbi:hypothetical protein SD37_11875 [Amycolatopsis orientalis]|uniref:Uncharacterized protein n=1 Tax=Amycolatopsis orientalis TaxID=31958 RepID=A0A193BVM7_AMYOR|nr:hypothetical protein [Amycolatopsis orientalis]ANN16277.1 hypothetical protein SD37_11875 [Amycolatopsis orientalis]